MSKIVRALIKPGASMLIALAVIVVGCGIVIYLSSHIGGVHYADDWQWQKEYVTYREQLDNLVNHDCRDVHSLDSAVHIIRHNQIALLDRQADLINDLRQETNNNIDKLNMWLAFAAIIISVVGVFLPLWIQYLRDKNLKDDFERLEKDSDIKLRKVIDGINEKSMKVDNNAMLQEMRSQFLSLSLGYDTRLINHTERERLYGFLWTKTVDAFNNVIKMSFENEKDKDKRRTYIIECLVLLCSFISRIKSSTTTQRHRKWDSLQDEMRSLIKEVDHGCNSDSWWNLYRGRLNDFLDRLNVVHLPE